MEEARNALGTHKHCQEAKWTLSLIAPAVPCRSGLQKDVSLVERLLCAVDELNCEISLKDIHESRHRVRHPACNTARWDGQNV